MYFFTFIESIVKVSQLFYASMEKKTVLTEENVNYDLNSSHWPCSCFYFTNIYQLIKNYLESV